MLGRLCIGFCQVSHPPLLLLAGITRTFSAILRIDTHASQVETGVDCFFLKQPFSPELTSRRSFSLTEVQEHISLLKLRVWWDKVGKIAILCGDKGCIGIFSEAIKDTAYVVNSERMVANSFGGVTGTFNNKLLQGTHRDYDHAIPPDCTPSRC